MNDLILWAAGGGGVFIVTAITFWMKLSSRISDATSTASNALEKVKSVEILAASAIAKCEFLARDVNHLEVDSSTKIAALKATTEATAHSLIAAETRLAKAVDDVAKSMDNLSETIIRTLGDLIANRRNATN